MKSYDLARMVYLACFGLGVLVVAFGLVPVQAATYEGQWTKIILDRVNPSSVDLKGTATFSGPDLSPKSYNLPATIPAARLASLAKGFLRAGVYGIAIDAAMQNGGWVWDEILRNWKKVISSDPPVIDNLQGMSCSHPDGTIIRQDNFWYFGSRIFSQRIVQDCSASPGCFGDEYFGNNCNMLQDCEGYFPVICLKPISETQPTVTVLPASPQDIFDDGVKPKLPGLIPDLITGLPDVIGTPTSTLDKAGNPVKMHWPEIVNLLVTLLNTLNLNLNIQNIIDQAIKDGVQSLTPDQTSTLTNNNLDINTIIQAITNLSNNTSLTTEQQQQIDNLTNIQNQTSTDIITPGSTSPTLEIPTDCDLIPFVCAWLEWYRGWLTEEPPPIPEVAVPIEDLSDFNPWPTSVSGSCPPPYQFSVFGKPVEVSYQPWCDLAVLIAPLLMGLAWLFASYIVLRVR